MTMNSSSVAPSPASSTSSSAGVGSGTIVNASRLRENQRRSRARKKEYLLSLEARFQACQRTGIEANIDIQIAAKKVVRENLILRGMLKMRGVTDGEIEKTLKDGGEGCMNGQTAVEGVLKVLGKRPCSGGGPTVGGTAMQCKPTGAPPPLPRAAVTERRNSTGMVAARETDRGGGRGAVTGSPSLAVTTSRYPSLSLSPQRHTLSNYPTPTPTPTAALASNSYALLPSSHMNNFYSYGISSSPSRPTYTSPTLSNSPLTYASPTMSSSSPTYASYQMTPSVSNSCCAQPQASFYPTAQSQCASSSIAVSSPCCPPQHSMYSTTISSSPNCLYQTTPISSTTPCNLAQSFIDQLHPGLPNEATSHIINSICPPEMMNGDQCQIDNAVLFAVLDKI